MVATHLSHLPRWNTVQLAALRRRALARGTGGPRLLVMGDLNLPPAAAQRLTGLRPLAAGPTFPARAPRTQVDHLLGRGLAATSAGTLALPFSDHRALFADLVATARTVGR